MRNTNLGNLVDAYIVAQRARIQWGNRIDALKRGSDTEENPRILQAEKYMRAFNDIEVMAYKEFCMELDNTELAWPWLRRQRGIKAKLGAKLVCRINIERTPRVSNLWSLAGFSVVEYCTCSHNRRQSHPEDKKCKAKGCKCKAFIFGEKGHPRLNKGEKRTWDAKLKTTCWLIASSFLKHRSEYCKFYYEAKEDFARRHPDWPKNRIHKAAMGKMIKIFLFFFWKDWRTAAKLPISDPYPGSILGHTMEPEPGTARWTPPAETEADIADETLSFDGDVSDDDDILEDEDGEGSEAAD